jgi:hypothetical protein
MGMVSGSHFQQHQACNDAQLSTEKQANILVLLSAKPRIFILRHPTHTSNIDHNQNSASATNMRHSSLCRNLNKHFLLSQNALQRYLPLPTHLSAFRTATLQSQHSQIQSQ